MSLRLAALRLAASKPAGDPLREHLSRLAAGDVTWAKVKKVLDKFKLTEGRESDENDDWDYYQEQRYSGRGMDGKISPVAVVIKDMRAHGPTSDVGKTLKGMGLSHDSMGQDVVYYLFGSSTGKTATFSLDVQSKQWVSLFVKQMSLLDTTASFDGAWQIEGDVKIPYLDRQTVTLRCYLLPRADRLTVKVIHKLGPAFDSMFDLALGDLMAARGAQLLSDLRDIQPSDRRSQVLSEAVSEALQRANQGPSVSLVEGPISTILLWLRQQPSSVRMDPVWTPLLEAEKLAKQNKSVDPVWLDLKYALEDLSKRYRIV